MKPWEKYQSGPWAKYQSKPEDNRTDLQKGIDEYGSITGSWGENFLAGAGKGFVDIGRGIKDFAIDTFGSDEARAKNDAAIAESRQRDQHLLDASGGTLGNIAGTVAAAAPTAFIPGANTVAGAGLIGAGTAALQPTVGDERATNVAVGGLLGAGGNALARGAGRVLSPKGNEIAKGLVDEVELTPGQLMGGAAKRAEDAAVSIPLVGDSIRNAQQKALNDWNVAAGNKVLAAVGEKLPKGVEPGRGMVKAIGDKLSSKYNELLPKLKVIQDDTFKAEINTLKEMVDDLPDGGTQFNKIIEKHVMKRFSPNGGMAGETMKEADEQIGKLVRQYGKQGGDAGRLGDALKTFQSSLRDLVERSNPEKAAELKNINKGWAMLTRIEDAAAKVGSADGIFTPEALRGSVKNLDRSARRRAVARGDALLQDFADEGVATIGSKLPNSGTTDRALLSMGLGGLAAIEPTTLAAMGGLGLAYGTKAGRKAANAAVSARPEAVRKIGGLLGRNAKYAPAVAQGLLAN